MRPGVVLAGMYLLTIGGLALWAYKDPAGFGKTTRKARKKAEDTTGLRLPRPDILVAGPKDEEDFDMLDEVICTSSLEVNAESPDLAAIDHDAYVEAVTMRALKALIPEFPWPAETGDHSSSSELQGLVRYEVARSLVDKSLCLTGTDEADPESDGDGLEDEFIPPPGE